MSYDSGKLKTCHVRDGAVGDGELGDEGQSEAESRTLAFTLKAEL
ncbi:MAG: hypothetical protein WC784_06205 [Candidatus Shapirobacteria bacterium]|jgi:hypothetical protein